MQGTTLSYSADPKPGEYVIGVVDRGGLQVRRARKRYIIRSGQLVVWDPSEPHTGVTLDGRPWAARLLVLEPPSLERVLGDAMLPIRDLEFARPVSSDPRVVLAFTLLHRLVREPATTLEREEALSKLVSVLVDGGGVERSSAKGERHARSHPAVRRALEYLREHLVENVSLAELARASGVDKFRLTRLFREGIGMPPHRFQIAQRVLAARRMLEAGDVEVGRIALSVGFADQSHLYRHFRSVLGITPLEYARRFATRGTATEAQPVASSATSEPPSPGRAPES